jgi:hypothetical protein
LLQQTGGGNNSSSSTSGSNAPSMSHAMQHPVEVTVDASKACNTGMLNGLHTAAGHRQPASAIGPAAAAAACPAVVVVFLSNTMGSTSYGVAQDASVHIIRGEHTTEQVQPAAARNCCVSCSIPRCACEFEAKLYQRCVACISEHCLHMTLTHSESRPAAPLTEQGMSLESVMITPVLLSKLSCSPCVKQSALHAFPLSCDCCAALLAGFTQRRVAGSMSGFLQHLLT